jgi:hypothetical protein
MSIILHEDKIQKYRTLRDLALAQVDAVEEGDQNALDTIIEQKWQIIRSLSGTKELLKTEPLLAGILDEIRDADKLAEEKLATRMGSIRNKLTLIGKAGMAKKIYAQASAKKHPLFGFSIDKNTPRFFDLHS